MTPEDEAGRDREQISILATFHIVIGILGCLAAGFVVLQYAVLKQIVAEYAAARNTALESGMGILGMLFAFVPWTLVGAGLLCMGSGVLLKSYRCRLCSQCVAGLLCFAFPFGTILGVMTLIVLSRPSAARLYGS